MSRLLKLYFFVSFNCILIECMIPGTLPKLTVRKEDKKLIEKKRQDTVDMCRIFTEENEKFEKFKVVTESEEKTPLTKTIHSRIKRGLQDVNPALNEEDSQRVEGIVDKMYDDLQTNGEIVDYTRTKIPIPNNTSTTKVSGRRYFFAPKLLEEAPKSSEKNNSYEDLDLPGKNIRFKHGIIPYFIDSKTYDVHLAQVIMKAFDYFEKRTCLRLQRLRERPTDLASLKTVEWLYITNPTGIRQCVHSNENANIKGVQMVIFGYDCLSVGDIVHELMHLLGFSHEHIRPDRDQHITILWDNIKPGYKKFFEIYNASLSETMPYDYASVLHYPSRAFSRNGQATIKTKTEIKIGQRDGLSLLDTEKISSLYSVECMKRNKEYLLTTCPSVIKASKIKPAATTHTDIDNYYENKIWPFGIVNYKLNNVHFSEEEKENIRAVINHIEEETCIEFRNIDDSNKDSSSSEESAATIKIPDKGDNPESKSDNSNQILQGEQSINDTEQQNGQTNPIEPSNAEIVSDQAAKNVSDENGVYSNDELGLTEQEGTPAKAGKRFLRLKESASPREQKPLISKKPVNKTKIYIEKMKRLRNSSSPLSASRRHATNVLTFVRSSKPGCTCTKSPGAPGSVSATIEINADCFNSVNDLLHLFVHVLGLGHQHNSYDRDSYLHIVWDQLTDDVREDMDKKLPPAASAGFPYDYQSVMHFPWLQIKNGRTNIMYPIWNDGWAMGHWQGLSSTDVRKLNIIYNKQCEMRRKAAKNAESQKNIKGHSVKSK